MHRLKIAALLIFPSLAFLCLSDTAQGQTITVESSGVAVTSPVIFNVPAGTSQTSAIAQQSLSVVPSEGPTTVSLTEASQSSFLYLNGVNTESFLNSVPTTGTAFTVAVNTVNLSAGTSVPTTFKVCYSNGSPCATVSVTLNVTSGTGNSGTLSSNPTNLTFTALQGATAAEPTSTSIEILNSAANLSYNIVATEQTGGSWLLVNNLTSTSGVENSTQIPVTISSAILPTLAAGTYNGALTATDSNNNVIAVAVTLTVTAGQALTPSPLAFTYLYQVGGTVPAAQTLTLSSNSGTISYDIALNPGVSWLTPTVGESGAATPGTPATVTLAVNPTGLSPGTYTTNVIVFPSVGNQLTPIPVSLVVSKNSLLELSTSSLTFIGAFTGASPVSQTVQLTTLGTGSAVGFSASSDSAWLSVSPNAGTTPATLTVSVNTASQPVGTFTGHITVTPTNGDNYTETVTVSLTVSNSAQVSAAPSSLLFSYEATESAPGPQSVLIQSTGPATSFSYTVNPNVCSGSSTWLSVTPSGSTTPSTLQVNVNAVSLNPGVCTGSIAVTAAGTDTPVNINVTVAVADGKTVFPGTKSTAELTVQQPQGFGYFNVQPSSAGVAPQTATLFLGSTDGTAVPYSVGYSATSNLGWLSVVGSTGGNTPQNVTVQAFADGLAAGTYSGQVTITSPNLPAALPTPNAFSIPILMVVTPNVSVTASPGSLAFSYTSGGATPANQSLTLTAAGGVASYTASVGNASNSTTNNCASLISLSPSSGTLNPSGTITVSVASTSSTAGTVNCQIALTYLDASTAGTTIPVTLTVGSPVTVTAAPTSLSFAYTINGSQPASQQLTVSSTGGSVQFSVGTTTTSGGNWLSVDTTTGTTAGSGTTLTKVVNVSVSTTGLTGSAAGTAYTGTISITSPGVLSTAITIAVTLTVTQPPSPQFSFVTNNASNVAGVIAPGELVTIKGTLLGPTTPANFTLNSSGGVSNTLSGVQVTFNNIPGTPIYVSATQINVTVPWEINGQTSANVVVTYNGNSSAPTNVSVNTVAPAIYTLNSTGSGQAAAINQNGTFNGPAGSTTVPAPEGSVVVLYATGCGQTSPPGTTGSVSPTTQLLEVTAPVSVSFGPLSNPLYGTVKFIGAAPGLVTGVCQVNVQLPPDPTGALAGNPFVTLTVNGVSSTQGPTIAVQ